LLWKTGGPWATSLTFACLRSVALDQGNTASAEHLVLESLTLGWGSDDRWFVGHALASLAIAAERQQQSVRATRLIGVVDGGCDRIHARLLHIPPQAARFGRTIEVVRWQLGEESFAAARRRSLHVTSGGGPGGDDHDRQDR
jgi:hypothetical protein